MTEICKGCIWSYMCEDYKDLKLNNINKVTCEDREMEQKLTVEYWGTVEDLDKQNIKGSWSDDATTDVIYSLKAKGFDDEDVVDFSNFLVTTETGDYTQIYGIKKSIPYIWVTVYVFKINGEMI